MASLDMKGPYRLTREKVDEIITMTSPGNYALGYVRDDTFFVYYIGRSDDDVNERVKQWVGEKPNIYTHFKFSYATSTKAAFDKECKNYHDFGGSEKLDNEYHPQRPYGKNWICLYCSIFD